MKLLVSTNEADLKQAVSLFGQHLKLFSVCLFLGKQDSFLAPAAAGYYKKSVACF